MYFEFSFEKIMEPGSFHLVASNYQAVSYFSGSFLMIELKFVISTEQNIS